MSDRFDLEQEILECWKVCDDIKMFMDRSATEEEIRSLSVYYNRKFDKLWSTFEDLTHNGALGKSTDGQSS